MKYNWICIPVDRERSHSLAEQLNVSPVTAQILLGRGVKDLRSAQIFFESPLKELHDPFLMKDMEKAVNKIISLLDEIISREKDSGNSLIDAGSSITIYGDYDVDGTTGTALLVTFFRELGIKVAYYIPERQTEGYGLNTEAIKKIAASGGRLIISVDCGISSFNEVMDANNLGVDVIITDHHQVPEKIPPAFAILNPSQENCSYPYKELSGVGVAFKLIMGIRSSLRENRYFKDKLPNLKKHLDLAALGTIADMGRIEGENRLFISHGLTELSCTQKPGLAALIKVAGCHNKNIETSDVGFLLGPRLNAAGRLETAESVVKLLTSENTKEVNQIADYLDEINFERQNIQKKIFLEAVDLIESNPVLKKSYTIVIASESWHQGVIGIVASKLISKYYRPTILIALNGSGGKASGRSIEGFNMYENVVKCSHLLEKYGGHKMAVGFSIKKEMVDKFKKSFEEESHKSIKDTKIFTSPLKIDADVPFDEISVKLFNELELMAPFGFGNTRPVVKTRGVTVPVQPSAVGKNGDHLKLKIKDGSRVMEAIGFNLGNLLSKFDFTSSRFDIAYSISINKWNNKESLQLKLKDIRLSD